MISLELRIHESPKATQASNFPPLRQEAVHSWNSLCELVGRSYPSIQTAILNGRQGNRVDSVTRHRDCGRTRRPPRHQAREHFHHPARTRQGSGLWVGEGRLTGGSASKIASLETQTGLVESNLTSPGSTLGTVAYMSPVQLPLPDHT
jgi:hypothetical protein